jgi:hypothetical protein
MNQSILPFTYDAVKGGVYGPEFISENRRARLGVPGT